MVKKCDELSYKGLVKEKLETIIRWIRLLRLIKKIIY